MDLTVLDFDALKSGISERMEEIDLFKDELKRRAKAELLDLRKREEELAELIGDEDVTEPAPEAGKDRGKGTPKYRHPDHAEVTWTGRGKKPKWMREWIMAGKDPNDLLIDPPSRDALAA